MGQVNGSDVGAVESSFDVEVSEAGFVGGDPNVAFDGDIESESNGDAVDGGDGGFVNFGKDGDGGALYFVCGGFGAAFFCFFAEEDFVDVVSCVKGFASSGDNEHAVFVFGVKGFHGVPDFFVHEGVAGVHDFGAVEGQGGDAVGVFVQNVFVGHVPNPC